jgi:glyoxylase-like metal-dependent hydrolase (beta-lactamase superfamily II)
MKTLSRTVSGPKRLVFTLFVPFLLIYSCSFALQYGNVTSQKVADGVYLFRTTPYGDVGFSGNSVAILTDECVLVFDTNGIPQSAERILVEIRKLTDKPVRYVINSHWHWDHWSGNQVYQSAFPDVQIISHQKTLELMKNVEPRWNGAGLRTQLPAYLVDFRKKVEAAKKDQASSPRTKELEDLLIADENFLTQKTTLRKILPNVTFSESMTVRPGGREIRILHARAITAGDTYVYLPDQKILITGDIVMDPYPFAIGGTYPADWLKTLEQFAALNPSLIIPGHGKAQQGERLLKNYVSLFRELLNRVKEAKTHGLSLQQTLEAMGKEGFATKMDISDPQTAKEFKAYFLDVFVSRAYKEIDAPLSDLPDGHPD